jgi:polyhydroxyalkanoate synthesis regulator protein
VIAEQETDGDPIMSQDFLSQMIRAYGGTMQGLVGDYLEQSLKLFSAQQNQIRDRVRSMVGIDPMTAMTQLAQENFHRWSQMQEAFLKSMTGAPSPRKDDSNDPKG